MAEPVVYVIAEDIKEVHIAEDVADAAVEEGVSDKLPQKRVRRGEHKVSCPGVEGLLAAAVGQKEYDYIGGNQCVIRVRRLLGADTCPDRQQHILYFTKKSRNFTLNIVF
ncbi:MAG: hypothetical protein A2173_02365 [Planctomycetes bacterium RBG_13_44_8b]|nr:MAG: hypothetical protein A2173_02365 [Planctomycetes bacterium RBG_13_44_8b]